MKSRIFLSIAMLVALMSILVFTVTVDRVDDVNEWMKSEPGKDWRKSACIKLHYCSSLEVSGVYKEGKGFVTVFHVKGDGQGAVQYKNNPGGLEEMAKTATAMARQAGVWQLRYLPGVVEIDLAEYGLPPQPQRAAPLRKPSLRKVN